MSNVDSLDSFNPSLMWMSTPDEQSFRRILAVFLLVTSICSIIVTTTSLPLLHKNLQERVPAHFVQLVLPPPEIIEPTVESIPLPELVQDPLVEMEVVREVEKVVSASQTVKQARETAKLSGLLAFKEAFNELRDVTELHDTSGLSRGAGTVAELDRSLLVSAELQNREVSLSSASLETGGVAFARLETTKVKAVPNKGAAGAIQTRKAMISSERSIEKVRRVFDANKGAIYTIYNRALRKNPGLFGKIVLELVIEPDGHVSRCVVLSSDMQDEVMITKLVQRIQLFDFGVRDVIATKISYPVHFLPS